MERLTREGVAGSRWLCKETEQGWKFNSPTAGPEGRASCFIYKVVFSKPLTSPPPGESVVEGSEALRWFEAAGLVW